MAHCRIYLFTYKRNHLLPRAVQSLIDQTFTSWVCEVHNDCPGNNYPSEYIQSLNDPRFIVKDHVENLGPVSSFNLAFAGCEEDYASILEDDNWWEPDFLLEMVAIMDNHPDLKIAWSNMRLWQESENNIWNDTGRTIWPEKDGVTCFSWPAPQQALGALHSNGAMLYRGNNSFNYIVPKNTLFNAIELVRERSFEHPIYLANKPLANFAITRATNRSNNPWTWISTQTMMLASFIAASTNHKDTFRQSLEFYRTQSPTPIANFFLANIFILKNTAFYKFFNLRDWFIIGKWIIKNGHKLNYIKKYLSSQTDTYQFLLKNTRIRYSESKKQHIEHIN